MINFRQSTQDLYMTKSACLFIYFCIKDALGFYDQVGQNSPFHKISCSPFVVCSLVPLFNRARRVVSFEGAHPNPLYDKICMFIFFPAWRMHLVFMTKLGRLHPSMKLFNSMTFAMLNSSDTTPRTLTLLYN